MESSAVSVAYFRRLFTYDAWANREAAAAVDQAGAAVPPRAVSLLAHLVGAQWLWLERLGAPAREVAVWPDLTAAERGAHLDALERAWTAFLGGLDADGLDRRIAYTNSRGEPWESRVEDVLTHLLAHGAYHRGQVALLLRGAGAAPAYTDFIHAVRQGFVI